MKIKDEPLQKLIGWSPHEGQQKVLDSNAKETVIAAGRRWGKSQLCAYEALKTLLLPNKHIWIVAPTYDLADRIFEYLAMWFLKVAPEQGKGVSFRVPQVIKTPDGSWAKCKSADNPTSLLGEETDLVIIDEAARISKNVFDTYIYPTTASRKGRIFLISTPFGQNWFYQHWLKAKTTESDFNFRSIDNPHFPKSEWEHAEKGLPTQVFMQEYAASFLPDAAAVFRGVDEVIKDSALSDAIAGHHYVMGVDLGKHEDYTVVTIIDQYNNNVVYFNRFKQIDYPFQKQRIEAAARRYNNARIIIDSTVVGEPIKEDLERQGLFIDDFKFTNKSKKELIEKLSIYIEQKQVWIPPEEVLLDEIKSFGYHLTDSGNVIYKAPEGLHDDAVFSLALAVWGLTGKAHPMTPIQEVLKSVRRPIKENFI